jgi:hemerythrin HHE cation binding domain-containing protein
MLERILLSRNHAIAILLKDHDNVKRLFDRFERSKSSAEKDRIIAEAITELKIHASLEEEIFYPSVRLHVGKDVMNEADEEHHVARVLIAELDRERRSGDRRDAKFTVLAESVRHHIKEEESEMLPKAKEVDIDFIALGRRMMERKQQLKRDGVPPDAEHAMVAAAPRAGGDTPAENARRRSPSPTRSRRKTAKRRGGATRRRATR